MIINEKNFLGDNMNYLLEALVKKLEGDIEVHKANVMVYVKNPAGIGEHSDIVEAVLAEMEKIAQWQDILDVVDEHFDEGYDALEG